MDKVIYFYCKKIYILHIQKSQKKQQKKPPKYQNHKENPNKLKKNKQSQTLLSVSTTGFYSTL